MTTDEDLTYLLLSSVIQTKSKYKSEALKLTIGTMQNNNDFLIPTHANIYQYWNEDNISQCSYKYFNIDNKEVVLNDKEMINK